MELIKDTCRQVERWLGQCANPVVLWSGGKDSTAMLHLIRYEVGANLPVIQWREPRFRSRYAFSDPPKMLFTCPVVVESVCEPSPNAGPIACRNGSRSP